MLFGRSLDFVNNNFSEKRRHLNIFCFNVDVERKALVPPGYSKTSSRSNSLTGTPKNIPKCQRQHVDISKNNFLFCATISL